jgi:hypothetical protein
MVCDVCVYQIDDGIDYSCVLKPFESMAQGENRGPTRFADA